MSSTTDAERVVKQRFEALFLDVKAAQESVLNADKPKLNVIQIEQSKTARSLLQVEKQAIREKDLNVKSDLNFVNAIANQIDAEVEKRLEQSLKDTDSLYAKVVGIDTALPELLDLVSLRAATISKIEPLATELPWLYNDLMKLVNQPKYRRTDNKGKVILVDTMRVGLNFFGLDNLLTVFTSLAFKRSLPQITDPHPQIKLRIWEEALATAISCKQLAAVTGVNQNNAFCMGMLQMVGKVAVTKLYFKFFETVLREALIETQNARKHDEYYALTRIVPSGAFLNLLIGQHASKISANIIEKMAMNRVSIANAVSEVANNLPTANLSPLGQVLRHGRAYAQYRILKKHKLIDLQLSKDFIRTLGMPKGSLTVLKSTDLSTLDLSIKTP